jgi:hypothetical protein
MTSYRAAVRVLTDEQLVETHTKAQNTISYSMQMDMKILAVPYIKTARAAEREIRSRTKYLRPRRSIGSILFRR